MYEELVKRLREAPNDWNYAGLHYEAADAIEELQRNLNDCRNELCLKCGEYKTKHLGSCDGCRWEH